MLFGASPSYSQDGRWLQTQRHGSIAYFLSGAPAELARYDLAAGEFLAEISFEQPPTGFFVDDDGIYVAFTQSLARFDLDGSNMTPLANAVGTVRELVTYGNSLYGAVESSPNFIRVDKLVGGIIELPDFFYSLRGLSVGPTVPGIFGRSVGISPADIVQISLSIDGALGAQADSPYHGDYPSANRTWVFPDEARVLDDAGIVYSTQSLTYEGSLNGIIDHVTFDNNAPIVLRGSTLERYSNELLSEGSAEAVNPLHSIYAYGTDVIGFFNDSQGNLATEAIPLSTLVSPDPGDPIDPNGLAYRPDAATIAADGSILLFSKTYKSIFRWSVTERRYTQSVPLAEAATFFAYSKTNDIAYLGYDDGRITQVDMVSGEEASFASVPSAVLGLAVADPFVFAVDPAGAWVSHFTFDAAGQLISQVEWNYQSEQYLWNEANRKMYFLRDDTSPNDLLWEDIDINGVIGAMMDSPYHDSTGIAHPIRVAPNGSFVLLGSGRIYNALTLELLNSLPNPVVDGQWRTDGSVAAVVSQAPNVALQELSTNFFQQKLLSIESPFAQIVPDEMQLHVVWEDAGIPRFFTWNFGTDDIDGDDIDDDFDMFVLNPDEWADNDGDGLGDNEDPDDDNDGFDDIVDVFPFDPAEWLDTDGDLIGNNADQDDDNDSVLDEFDAYPLGRFTDTVPGHWAFFYVEALERAGITGGCGADVYCPDNHVTRAQMAVFIERGMHGSNFIPPAAAGNVFFDVAAADFAASFIEQLYFDGITGGCGGGNYCPGDTVTRAQMAVFLLRARYGAAYRPPPASGIFDDVESSYWAAAWIEQLAAEGITSGCGNNDFCPDVPVTRGQMAVFLVRTFEL